MWPQKTKLEVVGDRLGLKRDRQKLENSKNRMSSLVENEPSCRFTTNRPLIQHGQD